MENIFSTSQSLGEIVSILPKASEVFRNYNIDFCCGGGRPLSEAISEGKLDEGEVLGKLDEAFEEMKKVKGGTDFRSMPSGELMDYLVDVHHGYLRRALPEISELTVKILRVHGLNHSELFRVHKLFHTLKTELEQHLIKEEEILFPMLKEYGRQPSNKLLEDIGRVMGETENEHEAAGEILKELRKITGDYSVPQDGCNSFRLAYEKLKELESDLFEHIHLENNILFKRTGIKVN